MGLFKKRGSGTAAAKRKAEAEEDDKVPDVAIVKKAKTTKPATNEEKDEHKVAEVEVYKANSELKNTSDATKHDRLFTEDKSAKLTNEDGEKYTIDDGLYHGAAGYAKFIKPREGKKKFGPLKAAGNIRSTTLIDYQPDVCKDYKLTGYCGYGDSCKFLHAREDYAAGWKLDQEQEEKKKTATKDNNSNDKTSKETKTVEKAEIPFKCVICKKDYKSPVKTTCNHYFCEACFFKRYKKSPSCFICGKDTNGVAKPASKDIQAARSSQAA
ncbi:pre-mRNA-splicing factor Cwc24p [Trichomonascus vanleenenianus]|uniref:U2-type spliceosomal complex subunit CWC24 n=1 Tax=Trichomonascus vanleenenianus TaxID=2268995 RepID=UPI003EC9CE1B